MLTDSKLAAMFMWLLKENGKGRFSIEIADAEDDAVYYTGHKPAEVMAEIEAAMSTADDSNESAP